MKISSLGSEGVGAVFRKSLLTAGYIVGGRGRETMEDKEVIIVTLGCVRKNKMR